MIDFQQGHRYMLVNIVIDTEIITIEVIQYYLYSALHVSVSVSCTLAFTDCTLPLKSDESSESL